MTVRTEIESKLATWAAAQTPVVPVAYQNAPFVKPTAAPYLEIYILPAAVVNTNVAATGERETGLIQITVCVPQNEGNKRRDALIAMLAALFPVLPKTGTVSIERPPYVADGKNRTDGFYATPVTFSYRQER